ncbi:glycosyltransferase family 4 protein [Clostridium cylindrosporum]|uniref:Glycosyl transferase n=1 Tax=Clostridium cylindrosporum DSM 605 TaxID=1121307 RepID=A0A0J8DBE6_CLOCY|nr:glycosyltransferase family 4 protein [Clostridium cylindrosporum]KMT23157.1 glycosyl transferase [Clostridium cylindrosporum DSM 605]
MKRILHVIAQYPGKTGSGIFLQSLVNEGSKLNYSQGVVAATSKKLESVKFKNDHIKFYPVEFNTDRINFDIVGMSDIMPYDSTRYSDLNEEMFKVWKENFLEVFKKALDDFKPNVIIAHHLWILTSIIGTIKKDIKLIVLSQGTELRQLKLAPYYKDMVIKGCENVDIVCALNNYQRDEIIRVYNIDSKKIKVMGVGYNSDTFYHNSEVKSSRKVVYAGKISSSKGLKCLISSFKTIKDNRLELIIAGSGSEEIEMKKLAEDDNRIKFLGAISQESLANVIRESQVFILPSFYEGLPLVIMEALACGAKVVMSDIDGVKQWVGDKINSSGAIKYIDLPRLINTDVPHDDDIKEYEERIKYAILQQLEREVDFNDIYDEVKKRSWSEYFENIAKYFK